MILQIGFFQVHDIQLKKEHYQNEKKRLEAEQSRLKSYLDAVKLRFTDWIHDAERLMTFSEHAIEEFNKGTLERKRAIITALGTEHILRDREIELKVEKPLLAMQKVVVSINSTGDRLEPPKSIENYGSFVKTLPTSSLGWT
jgi:hypothetical protein